jgi:hypothetical protein
MIIGTGLSIPSAPALATDDGLRNVLPPSSPPFRRPDKGVLFADDFSGDSLSGWKTDRPEVWTLRNGMLRGDLPDRKQERSVIRAGSLDWRDYAVDLDVCLMRGVDKGVIVRLTGIEGIGVDMRGPGYQDVLLQQGFRSLGRADAINGNTIWHHLRVEARGKRYRVFVNGVLVIETVEPREPIPMGGIGLPAYTGGVGKCTVYYDNVVVTSLGRQKPARGRNP